ncbi:MAG TPA: dNTP triphosphohydrolase [Acidobacteriaceae bacterium]|nr:dNTP triphosphohydrolase [Acidobacteriaceae bacterium]
MISLHSCAVENDANGPLVRRHYPERPHAYRTAFQRDRDRVIHARAFRRLAGKTQVFTHRYSDHFRSRLTHTIEVAQIARTVANALGLNEDLTETLALVHDIGHPPFGHAGEQALDHALMQHGLRFDHNLHALRIVEHFEQRYVDFRGLNLTLAVREGIIKHSHDYRIEDHPELAEYFLDRRPPLEAQIIDLADEIAYLTADVDDGMEAEILALADVRTNVPLFAGFFQKLAEEHANAPDKLLLLESLKRMLNALVGDLIATTHAHAKSAGVRTLEDVYACPERLVNFSPAMEAQRREAKRYLYQRLYGSPELVRDNEQGGEIIGGLFAHWMQHPEQLPASHAAQISTEGAPRVIADYIAGMTDNYCFAQWDSVRE